MEQVKQLMCSPQNKWTMGSTAQCNGNYQPSVQNKKCGARETGLQKGEILLLKAFFLHFLKKKKKSSDE